MSRIRSSLFLLFALACLAGGRGWAASLEEAQARYNEALDEIEEKEKTANFDLIESYMRRVERVAATAQEDGDLDLVLAAREEIARLKKGEPPLEPASAPAGLREAAEKYTHQLAEANSRSVSRLRDAVEHFAGTALRIFDQAEMAGDAATAKGARDTLEKLAKEHGDMVAAFRLPAKPVAARIPEPAFVRSFPRVGTSLAFYTAFDGLPEGLPAAGNAEIVAIRGVTKGAGVRGNGAVFGEDHSRIVATFPEKLATATEVSIAVCFKTRHKPGALVSLFAGDERGVLLFIDEEGRLGGHAGLSARGLAVTSKPVNDGQWHFAVIACDGIRATLYLDGNRVTSVPNKARPSDPTARLLIGATETRNVLNEGQVFMDWFFKGELDECFIFAKALNDNEVRTIHLMLKSNRP